MTAFDVAEHPSQSGGRQAAPPSEQPPTSRAGAGGGRSQGGRIERLKVIGGLVALGAGLVALVVVVIVALSVKPDTTGASIATSAIGVVGSIVGAYFGVKIGSDGTQAAIGAQQQEAAKAQVFALHMPPDMAETALSHVHELLHAQGRTD